MREATSASLAKPLVAGNPLEPQLRRVMVKAWPGREQISGIVIMLWIGQSACLLPKGDMLAYGRASETERGLVDNDGLSNLNRLKIQSLPFAKALGVQVYTDVLD